MKNLENTIYQLLFDKSTVDGVRIIHEDQWPVKEIVGAVAEMVGEIIGSDEEPYHIYAILPTKRTKMACENHQRARQRKKALSYGLEIGKEDNVS